MWIIYVLTITALLFLFRGLKVLRWGNPARFMLALFCVWGALVLYPRPMPMQLVDVMGRIIGVAAAALMAADILTELFFRIKAAILAGDRFTKVLPDYLSEICMAVEIMASRKTGALVVVSRNDSLEGHISGGMPYDAQINAVILPTIFALTSPVHDGAVIIEDGRITRVKTVLPIKTSVPISLGVGTRHRAAVGLTEKTDAIVFVSSEERGEISVAFRGQLIRPTSPEEFRAIVLSAVKGKVVAQEGE